LTPDYLFHLLGTPAFYHHCVPDMTGVSVPHLSPSQIADFRAPVPPPHEQAEIIAHVAAETAAFELLIANAESAVVLLQERRAALISAAVTGKIDVRGVSAATEAQAA
jgi:type I restriction enzyme S subunit